VHGPNRPGQNDGFITALARPGILKSQSQAVKPRLLYAMGNPKSPESNLNLSTLMDTMTHPPSFFVLVIAIAIALAYGSPFTSSKAAHSYVCILSG
jgi:hypothetical protein